MNRALSHIGSFLLLVLATASCLREDYTDCPGGSSGERHDEVNLVFAPYMAGGGMDIRTKAPVLEEGEEKENYLENLWVLLYDIPESAADKADYSKYKLRYKYNFVYNTTHQRMSGGVSHNDFNCRPFFNTAVDDLYVVGESLATSDTTYILSTLEPYRGASSYNEERSFITTTGHKRIRPGSYYAVFLGNTGRCTVSKVTGEFFNADPLSEYFMLGDPRYPFIEAHYGLSAATDLTTVAGLKAFMASDVMNPELFATNAAGSALVSKSDGTYGGTSIQYPLYPEFLQARTFADNSRQYTENNDVPEALFCSMVFDQHNPLVIPADRPNVFHSIGLYRSFAKLRVNITNRDTAGNIIDGTQDFVVQDILLVNYAEGTSSWTENTVAPSYSATPSFTMENHPANLMEFSASAAPASRPAYTDNLSLIGEQLHAFIGSRTQGFYATPVSDDPNTYLDFFKSSARTIHLTGQDQIVVRSGGGDLNIPSLRGFSRLSGETGFVNLYEQYITPDHNSLQARTAENPLKVRIVFKHKSTGAVFAADIPVVSQDMRGQYYTDVTWPDGRHTIDFTDEEGEKYDDVSNYRYPIVPFNLRYDGTGGTDSSQYNYSPYTILRNTIYEINVRFKGTSGIEVTLKIQPWNKVSSQSDIDENYDPAWRVEESPLDTQYLNASALGVSAWTNFSAAADILSNHALTKASDGSWDTERAVFWPDAGNVTLLAYAPYGSDAPAGAISVSADRKSLTYTVPTDVSKQTALISGAAVRTPGADINLQMQHRLTHLRFAASSDYADITINSITVSGVSGAATLSLQDGTWSNYSTTPASYTLSNVYSGALTGGQAFLDGDDCFKLLPQAFAADSPAQISLNYTSGGVTRTVTHSLAGANWEAAHLITYNLGVLGLGVDPDEFILNVTSLDTKIAAGGTATPDLFTVQSYFTVGTSSDICPWTAEYYYDGAWQAVPPSWLSGAPAGGGGSIAGQSYTVGATDNTASTPVWGSSVASSKADARNLANYDIYGNFRGGSTAIPFETANSYVVSAPGWYKIPAVYGNAFKNGEHNPGSYQASSSLSGYLLSGNFVGHDDNPIQGPWITKAVGSGGNGITTSLDASLVWQDAAGMVTDISYEDDYVYFRISEAAIARGNAVVALTSGGTAVWSWHIWVVDEPAKRLAVKEVWYYTSASASGCSGLTSQGMLSENLGYHPGNSPERVCPVRITQDISGNTAYFYIIQSGSNNGHGGTYYQWGRKDPMWPASGASAKPIYYADGTSVTNATMDNRAAGTIGDGIQNPGKFLIDGNTAPSRQGWLLYDRYDNLWNMAITTQASSNVLYNGAVVKTIYDPCPPGFKMPNGFAFTGFNPGGTGPLNHSSIWGAIPGGTYNGMYFYCNPEDHSAGLIYFPTSGRRQHGNAQLDTANESYGTLRAGLLWTAFVSWNGSNIAYGEAAWFNRTQTRTVETANSGRARGLSVRPIQDN